MSDEGLWKLEKAYRLLFRSKLSQSTALERIEAMGAELPRTLTDLVRASERSICQERAARLPS